MMLPQHKEQINEHYRRQLRRVKPSIDEQQSEWIVQQLHNAMQQSVEVRITVFDEDKAEEIYITGKIYACDQQLQRIKVISEGRIDWIPYATVLDVE